ncbi:MAG: twin-arginine translocation signal domain-containing protein, partial [Planctomycetota bacterium]
MKNGTFNRRQFLKSSAAVTLFSAVGVSCNSAKKEDTREPLEND